MKTNNLAKLFKGIVLSAALITSVVACGKKTNDNQNVNAYQQSCTNCQNITGFPFFAAQTTAQGQGYNSRSTLRITWSFSGQNLNQPTSNNNGYFSSPAMNYSGQVSAIGQINVAAPIPASLCPPIPAGDYQLATQTVGTWNQGQISGLRLIVSGPVQFTAVLQNAQAQEYTFGYNTSNGNRVYGNLMIEQVNGYYCDSASYYMY